ncbi:hypothetical protein Emed_000928 [Eimeria media]
MGVPPAAATAATAAAAAAAASESAAAAAAAAGGGAGCLTNCDGRAVVSLGCTKVMALVYGPQPLSSSSSSSSSSGGITSSSGSWSISISDTTSASLQLLQEGRQGQGRGDVATPLSVVCSVGFVGSSVRLRNMYTPDTAEVATAVVALQLSGKVDRESYAKMFDLCLKGCLAAAECMKDALRDAADTRMLLSS